MCSSSMATEKKEKAYGPVITAIFSFLFLLIAGGHLSSYFYTAKQLIVKKKDHLGDESNVDWHVFPFHY